MKGIEYKTGIKFSFLIGESEKPSWRRWEEQVKLNEEKGQVFPKTVEDGCTFSKDNV